MDPDTGERDRYESGARIPTREWVSPSDSEMKRVATAIPSKDIARTVGHLRMPDNLVQILRSLTSEEIDTACGGRRPCDPIQDLLLSYIEKVVNVAGDLTFHGLISSRPNQRTVAFDPLSGKYIGLHLDSWDSDSDDTREVANNRIAINVGKVERSLLFVDQSVVDMKLLLAKSGISIDGKVGTELGRFFLRCFPTYPVLRLNIGPGEAYVAPTDFVMHDGCTLGAQEPSWHISIRGQFSF